MIYNKFNGILNLYKDALKLLSQDEDLKLNNISLTQETIEKGNYDNFTPWQKYMIVMLLIKNLLPLIETSIDDNDDLNKIYNSLPNLRTKTNSNIFNSESNILSKLSTLNFRSVFDKKIDICDSNIIDYTHSSKDKMKSKTLKSFNSETNINCLNNKKIQNFIKNNSFSENKGMKVFKAIKGKFRPIRFIHIENNFNFNFNKNKKDKEGSFMKNYFFD